MIGKYEFKAVVGRAEGTQTAPVSVFVGKPDQTKQLCGTVRLTTEEAAEFKQRLENPVTSTTETQETPIHWAQYDGLSVALTRSEADGKLIVVLESLTEETIDVRISRDADDLPIWKGTVQP